MSDDQVTADTLKILWDAISNPANEKVGQFIAWSFDKFVNEESLNYAIDNDLDIITLALNHYALGHSQVTPIFKLAVKMHWNEVESYLTNVEKIFKIIEQKPGCAKIINTERGRSYLNRSCKATYTELYSLIWGGEE